MRLWAVARYDLRLTEEEFWRLTPRQFFALQDRWLNEVEIRDYHAALVATILANIHRPKTKKPFKITDLMPDRRGRKAAEPKQTWQQQLALVKQLHLLFGGAPPKPKKKEKSQKEST